VFVVRCVGSGLCDELITRPEESHQVCVCSSVSCCEDDGEVIKLVQNRNQCSNFVNIIINSRLP